MFVAPGDTLQVTGINVNFDSVVDVITLSPQRGKDAGVLATSLDTSIATIDENWLITVHSLGDVTINFTIDGTEELSYNLELSSVEKMTSITLSPKTATQWLGQQQVYTYSYLPETATETNVSWSFSSYDGITAIETQNGIIVVGEAPEEDITITATARLGDASDTAIFHMKYLTSVDWQFSGDFTEGETVYINKSSIILNDGSAEYDDFDFSELLFESLNTEIATMSYDEANERWEINLLAIGAVEIQATYQPQNTSYKADVGSQIITVEPDLIAIETLQLSQTDIPWLGYPGEIEFTYTPSDAEVGIASWEVDQNGIIVNNGEFAYPTYTRTNISGTSTVTATTMVSNITATIEPEFKFINNITWSIESPDNLMESTLAYLTILSYSPTNEAPPDFRNSIYSYTDDPDKVSVIYNTSLNRWEYRLKEGGEATIHVQYRYPNIDGGWLVGYDSSQTITITDADSWGISIDTNNPDSDAAVSYIEGAAYFTQNTDRWGEIFGARPCLLQNGTVVGYLNPNNFAQFEDGTSADITSGSIGDVMVEFPIRGIKFEKGEGYLNISITKQKDNPEFTYLAFTRGTTIKDNLYIGAYFGWSDTDSKLRSLSGKSIQRTQTINVFRQNAQNNGEWYDILAFYQITYLEALALLKAKNLDVVKIIGRGLVGVSSPGRTGITNNFGMFYGTSEYGQRMKFAGIEDLLGNLSHIVDGVSYITVATNTCDIYTATTGFNDDATGYTNQGRLVRINFMGYTDVFGSAELGFHPVNQINTNQFYNTRSQLTYTGDPGGLLVGSSGVYDSDPLQSVQTGNTFGFSSTRLTGPNPRNTWAARLMYL